MSNRNGSIIQPNAMQVEATTVEGPLAQPAVVVAQSAAGFKVLTIGGLTKVESLAGQIAGRAMQRGDEVGQRAILDVAIEAIDIAETILAECDRRRKQHPGDSQ